MSVTTNLSPFFLLGKKEISWYCHARMKAILKKVNLMSVICVLMAGLLSSCQTPTPATRIAEYPAVFSSLPTEQQVLVRQGKICEGMSRDAVMLAWGKPEISPYVGQKNGKDIERWTYRGYQPVTVMSNAPYPAWGPYGWYGAYPTTSTAFIPRDVAFVEFVDGKVSSWGCNPQN